MHNETHECDTVLELGEWYKETHGCDTVAISMIWRIRDDLCNVLGVHIPLYIVA